MSKDNVAMFIILVYVDDFIIAEKTEDEIENTVQLISIFYSIHDMGNIPWFLSIFM